MDETKRIYLAGFFDGEGCVTIARTPRNPAYAARIYISQRDRAILDEIRGWLDFGTIHRHGKHGGHALSIARRDDVLRFIRIVYPFSRVKKEQLRLGYALAYISRPGRGGPAIPPELVIRRNDLAEAISARNLSGRQKPVANRHGSSRFD